MKKFKQLNRQRKNRVFRVANAVKRNSTRPRLCIFRSNKHIYAQIIDDEQGKTLVSAGTMDKDLRSDIPYGGNCAAAAKIGETIAKKALAADIKQVAFDRHGFKYHGRLRQLADAARKAGLDIGAASDQVVEKKVKSGGMSGAAKKAAKEAARNKAPAKKK